MKMVWYENTLAPDDLHCPKFTKINHHMLLDVDVNVL